MKKANVFVNGVYAGDLEQLMQVGKEMVGNVTVIRAIPLPLERRPKGTDSKPRS